jgi:hypothetical protein
MFFIDDIADVDDFPRYDEYNDDYEVEFPEKAIACSLSENDLVALYMENFISSDLQLDVCLSSENVPFQQSDESTKLIYDSYDIEYDENCESIEGNSLPLCFVSFKLLRENFETINEVEEYGLMQSHLDSMGKIDNELQQSPLVFHDPVVDYMEGFNSHNLQPMISCKDGSEDDHELVSKSAISLLPKDVLLQQSNAYFQSFYDSQQLKLHERKDAVEGLIQYDCLLYSFEDPFAAFLESASGPKFLNFFKVESICKFSLELLLSRLLIFPLKECKKGGGIVDKVLIWLHWIFYFT